MDNIPDMKSIEQYDGTQPINAISNMPVHMTPWRRSSRCTETWRIENSNKCILAISSGNVKKMQEIYNWII